MNPKVSILISVYNCSAYITKCAESLFNQSFEDIEFIFVDDVSPDDSIEKILKLLEYFPARKEQVRIIAHGVNRGTSASRNTALYASSGDYILIVDCDDYIEPDTIEMLYRKAVEKDADMVLSDYYIENRKSTVVVHDQISVNNSDFFKEFILYNNLSTVYWNKLIRRSLLLMPDCHVPEELNFLDDKHVIARVYYYASKIVKVDKAFYHYNKSNPMAITQSRNKSHFENVLLYWNLFDKFLYEHGIYDKYKPCIDKQKIKSKASLLIDTDSYSLRKEYAGMFYDEEMAVINEFKAVEKLMLLLIRNKMFILAHLFHKVLIIKRDIKNMLNK